MKVSRILLSLLTMFMMATSLAVSPPLHTKAQAPKVVIRVVAASIDVHSQPDAKSAIIGKLRRNGRVVLSGISADGSWLYFLYYEKPGWIPSDPKLATFEEGRREDLKVIDAKSTPEPSSLPASIPGVKANAYMIASGKEPVKLYAHANVEQPLTDLPEGAMVRLAVGPHNSGGYVWWWVRSDYGHGWIQLSGQGDSQPDQRFVVMTPLVLNERIRLYSDRLRTDPGDLAAYAGRGLAYYSQKRYDQASVDFSAVIKRKPDNAWAYFERALVRKKTLKSQAALDDLNDAVRLAPNEPLFLMARALVLGYHLRQQAEANKDFQKALELRPNFQSIEYHMFMTRLLNEGVTAQLMSDFADSTADETSFADFYVFAAHMYLEADEFDLALKGVMSAVEIEPTNGYLYAQLGIVQFYADFLDEARENMDKALALSPDDSGVYYIRGNYFNLLKQYAEANQAFTQAIQLEPYFAEAYINRSMSRYFLKQFAEAFADANRGIGLMPNEPIGYLNRAAIYFDRGQAKQALADYEKYLELGGKAYDWVTARVTALREQLK